MIFLDLETTGFDPKNDKIIEFSAVKTTNDTFQEIGRLDFLVNPETEIPKIVKVITKIKDEDVENETVFADKINEIKTFIGDDIIVGHNIQFDISFLNEYDIANDNEILDTCDLATLALPTQKSYALEVLSDIYDLNHKYKHRALGDVLACIDLLKLEVSEIQKFPQSFFDNIKLYEIDNTLYKFILNINTCIVDEKDITIESSKKLSISSKKIDNVNLIHLSDKNHMYSVIQKCIEENKVVSVPEKYQLEIAKKFNFTNIIYDKNHYISEVKLQNFFNKKEYDLYESLLLLKIIRNKAQQKELNKIELNIHYNEQPFWNELSLTEDRSKFIGHILNKTESTLITHKVFLKEMIDSENVVVFDLKVEDLDNIYRGSINEFYLQDLKNEVILKLISFLGKIKEFLLDGEEIGKYGREFLIEDIKDLSEFKNAALTLAEELSKNELYKKMAGVLIKFFSNDLAIKTIYINSDLKVKISVLPILYKELLSNIKNSTKFVGLYGSVLGDFSYFRNCLGKDDYESKYYPASANIRINLPENNFPGPKNANFMDAIKIKLDEIFDKQKNERIVVVCSSKTQIENLFIHFSLNEKYENRKILDTSKSKEKNLHYIKNNDNAIIFAQDVFIDSLSLSGLEIKNMAIIKLPFENPRNSIFKVRTKLVSNSFSDYSIPRLILKVNRSIRFISPDNLYFLDSSVKSNWAEDIITL